MTPKARFSSQSDDNPESSISTISKDKSKNMFENVTLLVKKKSNIKSSYGKIPNTDIINLHDKTKAIQKVFRHF